MIETTCQCGAAIRAPESQVGQAQACEQCGQAIHLVAAEALPEGAGAGDFDAHLLIERGPARVGEQILLGGVADITIGKLPDKHIALAGGSRVSRFHCTIARLDFGPSRWEIRDNHSTNGLFVNGERVETRELRDGDIITVGDYELRFVSTFERDIAAAQAAAAKATLAAGGAVCPSCGQVLGKGAKICVNCGVDLKTGRSLVVSKGLDEDDLAIRADTWIRTLSWIIPFGLFPIASEAFGTRKPISTWVILGVTCAVSVFFLIALLASDQPSPGLLNLMQWNGDREAVQRKIADARAKRELEQKLQQQQRSGRASQRTRQQSADEDQELTSEDNELQADEAEALFSNVDFHWYQLITSATLHEPQLIMPFVYHIGGNMLFLLVFGLRVNELVGNVRMAVLYVVLAIASGLTYHLATLHAPFHPSLGASGAVMGLAGMYFVFFPIQRVHMAIWFRGGMITRWKCFYKVFTMRGIWLLVMWIGLQDVLPTFIGLSDGVAHWAHLGGFSAGIIVALALLISRQTSAHGNDLLSVLLGKRAWALVGKPASHLAAAAPGHLTAGAAR